MIRFYLGKPPTYVENWIKNNPIAKNVKFAVLSDIHQSPSASTESSFGASADFVEALNYIKGKGVDTINMCGDITTDSSVAHLQAFKTNWQNTYPAAHIYSCTGNHDAAISDADWQTYVGHTKNFVKEVNSGVVYIYMSLAANNTSASQSAPYRGSAYGTDSIAWLQSKLTQYAGKRVFLFMHFPLRDSTVLLPGLKTGQTYGFSSRSTEPTEIIALLKQHNNIVVFSGHTHYEFGVVNQLEQYKNFYTLPGYNVSLVHVPSLTRPRDYTHTYIQQGNPYYQVCQGFIVNMVEDDIYLDAIEFSTKQKLDYSCKLEF